MPLYEFVCLDCKVESELLVRSPEDCPECPACQSKKLERQLSIISAPSSGKSQPEACQMPRCCGGGCQM